MQEFNKWLGQESTSETPTEAYTNNCSGASAVPVPSDVFDPCIISWSQLTNNVAVLQTDGRVKIMELQSRSNVVYDSPFADLKDEFNLYENWLAEERNIAPTGVNQMYHSDLTFWWFDTNQQMLRTAYGAAGIALVCVACVVFVSSRSFVLTLFAAISILYVLVAATACLVSIGNECNIRS